MQYRWSYNEEAKCLDVANTRTQRRPAGPSLSEDGHVARRRLQVGADSDVDADDHRRLGAAELDVQRRIVLQTDQRLRQAHHRAGVANLLRTTRHTLSGINASAINIGMDAEGIKEQERNKKEGTRKRVPFLLDDNVGPIESVVSLCKVYAKLEKLYF